jgi:chemotaxis protein MotB
MNPVLKTPENELQVWPSYTDVAFTVILLLLFYLFVQAIISSQTSAVALEIQQRQTILKDKVYEAVPLNLRGYLNDKPELGFQTFTFSDQALFDSGQAVLKQSGMDILKPLGLVLKERTGTFTRVQIEGHTDNQPIKGGGQFASNWELSSARATAVVRFLQKECDLKPELVSMSANGYSEYQPVASNDAEEGRRKNRRIEVKVFYEQEDIIKQVSVKPANSK